MIKSVVVFDAWTGPPVCRESQKLIDDCKLKVARQLGGGGAVVNSARHCADHSCSHIIFLFSLSR